MGGPSAWQSGLKEKRDRGRPVPNNEKVCIHAFLKKGRGEPFKRKESALNRPRWGGQKHERRKVLSEQIDRKGHAKTGWPGEVRSGKG